MTYRNCANHHRGGRRGRGGRLEEFRSCYLSPLFILLAKSWRSSMHKYSCGLIPHVMATFSRLLPKGTESAIYRFPILSPNSLPSTASVHPGFPPPRIPLIRLQRWSVGDFLARPLCLQLEVRIYLFSNISHHNSSLTLVGLILPRT